MRRKVTLKIFTPLLAEVESKLDSLHMKRDSFLSHLIDCELPHLQSDLQGKRLPVSVRRFIARSLKQLGTSQINVQLDSNTAERLDEIAYETNLLRDSFINRLLYFSLGSDSLLKYFDVEADNAATYEYRLPLGYLHTLHAIQSDPFAGIRKLVKAKHGIGLYLAPLPVELAAFECYLDEEIFWAKYNNSENASGSAGNLLQTFESDIY